MPVLKSAPLIMLIICCGMGVQADELDINNDYELPVTLQTLLENSGRENLINLVQLGTLNQAKIMQMGSQNYAYLQQIGEGNQADVIQHGKNNQVELLQVGTENNASITQVGNDNLVNLNQLGHANFSIEQLADGAEITITQY